MSESDPDVKLQPRSIHVNIGELKIGEGSDTLVASLGSCVGIAFLWKKQKKFGLAHCLLPIAPVPSQVLSARYVSDAVGSLMKLMGIEGRLKREVDAVVVGGGNMTAPKNTQYANLIGTQNAEAAEKFLGSAGIKIVHKDTGGESGRRITLVCETGEYVVKPIPRIAPRDVPEK